MKCSVGKKGTGIKKKEGDLITPKGCYELVNIFYRSDRVSELSSKLKLISIKKNMGWCDDPRSKQYNKLISRFKGVDFPGTGMSIGIDRLLFVLNQIGSIKPKNTDQLDIKEGIKTLNNLREYNYSQAVVVRNKKVISIEGKGGTKKMLEKSKSKKFRNHGVLVKFPKKKQDLRVDLPTIGLKTLKQSKTAGLKGIVVKGKQHIFLDKNKCISFANKNKMFISVK